MKKLIFLYMMVFLISGCSQATEVTNTATYVAGSADYIQDVHSFKNDIPKLILLAEKDKTRVEAVKDRIDEMKDDIAEFNALTPPESFKGKHDQVVEINEQFGHQLDNGLTGIDKGSNGLAKAKEFLEGPTVTGFITDLNDILKAASKLNE